MKMNKDYNKLIEVKCNIGSDFINLLIKHKVFKKSELIIRNKETKETSYTELGQVIFNDIYDTLDQYILKK